MDKILNLRKLFSKTKVNMFEHFKSIKSYLKNSSVSSFEKIEKFLCIIPYQPRPVHNVNVAYETATFGMGCFWSSDSLFGATLGVLRTKVGYSGGTKLMPKYKNIGDHVECVSVDYDPNKISYKKLLDIFWNNHEYRLITKRQYMSLILYHSEQQKTEAFASLEEEKNKRSSEVIATEIAAAGVFYPAEDYHQKFRLQAHKNFAKTLDLNSDLLLNSFVAAKLNGYLVGVGGVEQFETEVFDLGLNQSQIDYVKHFVKKHEGAGLYC